MWSVTPRCHSRENGTTVSTEGKEEKTRSSGQTTKSEDPPRLPGRMPLHLADSCLNMKLFLFPCSHINSDWTQSQGWPHGKVGQWITENTPPRIPSVDTETFPEGLLSTRHSRYTHYLISPWQWPHVAVGSESLHNLLKISELARNSEIWTCIYQGLKNALSIVHHGACPPVMIKLSKSAGGPQVYFQWQHLSEKETSLRKLLSQSTCAER